MSEPPYDPYIRAMTLQQRHFLHGGMYEVHLLANLNATRDHALPELDRMVEEGFLERKPPSEKLPEMGSLYRFTPRYRTLVMGAWRVESMRRRLLKCHFPCLGG